MEMRSIEIDFEVHQKIEIERKSFSESPNESLRRLLGLGTPSDQTPSAAQTDGRAWSGKGVTLPHGTELRMDYNGVEYRGTIDDGKWACGNGLHAGPSPAAAAVASTKRGKTPSLNGWMYWQAKKPGSSTWVPINEFRR